MDRVRFGRALGYGARHAARSLKQAAEAATAAPPTLPQQPVSSRPTPTPSARVAQRLVDTRQTITTTKTHAKTLGRSVWSPLAQFSSVLWLQVTGTFFTLLALFLSQGLWKARSAMRLPPWSHPALTFYLQLIAFIGFTFFAISNFVLAYLRGRQPTVDGRKQRR